MPLRRDISRRTPYASRPETSRRSFNVFATALIGDRDVAKIDFSGLVIELLAGVGRRPVSSAAHMWATALPPEIADLPEARPYRACLSINELCIDAAGEPVLRLLDYYRGDLFSFHALRWRESTACRARAPRAQWWRRPSQRARRCAPCATPC